MKFLQITGTLSKKLIFDWKCSTQLKKKYFQGLKGNIQINKTEITI